MSQDFKGKICYYSNVNGQIKNIEKEFDNKNDYDKFINENPEISKPFSLKSYFDVFDLNSFFGIKKDEKKSLNENPSLNSEIGFDFYENELNKIEEKKKNQNEEAKKKLLEYREKFEKEGRTDLVEKIDKDLSKLT